MEISFLVLIDHIEDENLQAIREVAENFHQADLALAINHINTKGLGVLCQALGDETIAKAFPDIDDQHREMLIENLDPTRIQNMAKAMDSDDEADFIALLDEGAQEKVLEGIEDSEAAEVRELLRYDSETAGGLMSKEFLAISSLASVEDAISLVRERAQESHSIYRVYVTEKVSGKLLGGLALEVLFLAPSSSDLTTIMKEIPHVLVSLDQEKVARVAAKYNLAEIPVVDEDFRLVGRITHDDILDVAQDEIEEDMARLVGTDEAEVENHDLKAINISRVRLPWLLIGLVGGLASAMVMSRFALSLEKMITLTFFVPVVMAMGGNVGIQSSTITVRGLATGEITSGDMFKRILRESLVGVINGLTCGFVLMILAGFWQGSLLMGVTVGVSLFGVIVVSTIFGTLIPLFLKKLNIDPALATGPFVTTLNDIVGLLIYLGLVSLVFLR